MNKKIAIIGCGNLGQSILSGLVQNQAFNNKNLTATKRKINSLEDRFGKSGVRLMSNNVDAVKDSDIILLGLKPYTILNVLEELRPHINKNQQIVSLATGVNLEAIENVIGNDKAVFRAMPNTAADVNESVTCLCSNQAEEDEVKQIFNSIGTTISIDENLMEAATVLGACGVAYVLRFMRAMIQGGIEIGFSAKVATEVVTQTVKGASELLIQNGSHPESEIDKVTTPKGCTIAGLNEMEHNGFSSALIKGILTSFEKI